MSKSSGAAEIAVTDVYDLHSALRLLEHSGERLRRVSDPVQAWCELAAIYAAEGAGVPVASSPRPGAPILFEQVMPAGQPVLAGLFGSRRHCAWLLGTDEEHIAAALLEAVGSPIAPQHVSDPPCQQIIHQQVSLHELPIPTMTPADAGAYITLGLVMAKHPVTGESNISIHRLWVKSGNELTIWMVPGRDLEQLYLAARELGEPLPVSINIGLDPAVYIASCCTGALAPKGFNELAIAGGLRKRPVPVSTCMTVDADCIAEAEYVLEGIITHEYSPEGEAGGYSLPEFLGYDGKAHPGLPVIRVTGITRKRNAIFQTVIGPGCEQSNLLAFGMEAAVLSYVRKHVTPRIQNAYCSSAGGGQLLLFMQFHKAGDQDDALVRQAGVAILGAFRMIKQVVLVDDDVNVFSEEEVWWAMATRFQADEDIIVIPKLQGFPLDPSQHPGLSPRISAPGITSKVIFDCTVPYRYRESFKRTSFQHL